MLYRVAWKSKLTDACGHGGPMEKHQAESWKMYAESKFRDLVEHWIEAYPKGGTPQ